MKRLIVALCSLALSCVGTFGINQLAPNDDLIIEKNMEQASIEQDAEEVEDITSLPDDKEKKETNEIKEDKVPEVEAAAPKADEAVRNETKIKEDTKNTKEEKKVVKRNDSDKVSSNDNTDKYTDKKSSNIDSKTKAEKNDITDKKTVSNNNAANQNTNNNVQQKAITNNTSQEKASDKNSTNSNSYKSGDNKRYVYKSIDLSNCKSTNDVIEKLQKNGYQNINSDNIKNISSLEDILSLIGEKGSQDNIKKPTSTTKPKETIDSTTPKETTPTTVPGNPSSNNSSYAEEVLRLVNIERSKAGLSSLTTNATLKAAADKRAQETAVSFSHTRPNGSKFSTVLQEYGISYRTAGENIAYGQRSPQEVVTGWMNSPGHRANILNGNFNKIGIGVYKSNGVIYWSQLFTN